MEVFEENILNLSEKFKKIFNSPTSRLKNKKKLNTIISFEVLNY